MSRMQGSAPTGNTWAGAKAAASGVSGGGDAGGNLATGAANAVSATWGARSGTPQAAGGVDQVANTIQQAITNTVIEAIFDGSDFVKEIRKVYDELIKIAEEYFQDFNADMQYWRGIYKPFLQDIYIPLINDFEYYVGDGRGLFVQVTPDRDLGRRGQLSAAFIKDIDIAWKTKRRIVSQYAHGEMRMDDMEASIRRYQVMIDQGISARRIEDIYEDEFNNRAWNRLLIGSNIGLTGSNIASAGYSSAMGAYMNSMQQIANYKTAMGNQISAAAGQLVGAGMSVMGSLIGGGG